MSLVFDAYFFEAIKASANCKNSIKFNGHAFSEINDTVRNILFYYRKSDLHVAKCLINSIKGISDVHFWDGVYTKVKKEIVKKEIEIHGSDFIQMEEVQNFVFEEVEIREEIRKIVVNYKFNDKFDYVSVEV